MATPPDTPGLPEFRPFDPYTATGQDLADVHILRAEATSTDRPEDPPVSYEEAIGRLRHQPLAGGPCRHWAAYLQDRLIGLAEIALPDGDNATVALGEIDVRPSCRRRGIGTALLRAAMPAILAVGRGTVVGGGLKLDGAGARWTEALGFQVTRRVVMQQLDIDATDPGIWEIQPPSGYRTVRWAGQAPADLLASFAAARPAFDDAPRGQTSYRPTAWTPQLIRAEEQELAAHGTEQRVVAALDLASGQVAGLTTVRCYSHRHTSCLQGDTSVRAEHRGHGLGRAVKAEMMRWLTADYPELDRVYTTTAPENVHMISINLAVGYHTVRTMIWTEITTSQLAKNLASNQFPATGR